MTLCPNFFAVRMINSESLINQIKLTKYESKSHKIKKIHEFVYGKWSTINQPHPCITELTVKFSWCLSNDDYVKDGGPGVV